MSSVNDKIKGWYRFIVAILTPLVHLVYPHRVVGKERLPEGSVMICANHSSYIDPILLAVGFGGRSYIRFMAKKELASVFFVGMLLRKVGAIPVDRGANDIEAVKNSIRTLKSGERLMLFPEGTRADKHGEVAAKPGAIRIASKVKSPILPVYIPRDKRAFRRFDIIVGEPYMAEVGEDRSFEIAAEELMDKIELLGAE